MNVKTQLEAFLNTPSLFLDDSVSGYSPFLTKHFITTPPAINILNNPFGKRMEQFLQLYFEQSTNYEILAQNVQINKEKITIGELDFIVNALRNHTVLHIELVSKFYVYNPDIQEELNRWIGPNKKDSLVQKLDKLKTKQFPLLHKMETKVSLSALEIDNENIEQKLCFKAQLYIPYQYSIKNIQAVVNLDCIVGFWLRIDAFKQPEFIDAQYYIPEKMDWYCSPNKDVNWESLSSCLPKIIALHKSEKSPLIWINKHGSIFEKCFIVWW